ncbi:nuclear transport factor 2 family protein [Nitrosomonas sp.]|uniref:nuclear transport factor 2 family protein n=1 Tax=Nitrosomonas sp. TaxID=42353 RepID=UPI001E013067|nr:nuclear transport factor 2 family protein [Nitrosomonas sp.]MCB1947798.1 nuclear transport factor 2 family protein [Nitrosomonas sp.]MCP5243504.1 nuclear transport factor 2 family protein [Burkholderiales bacterium]MDR4513536.1 nuclear transport factor 2 family protein [Nitrosomonas sp.]
MSVQKNMELAKNYIELSNKHDLRHIETLFLGEATYHSAYFGEYKGSVAIHEMMLSFFARYPDVHWEVSNYRPIGTDGVEFDFLMTATDAAADEPVRRQGRECIYFESDGLIRRIEVHKADE